MAHYSEMNFLFSNKTNSESINKGIENYSIFSDKYGTDGNVGGEGSPLDTTEKNKKNIFTNNKYVVFKGKNNYGTEGIHNYLVNGNATKNSGMYKERTNNPYVQLLKDFDIRRGQPGASLRLKAADLSYLRELGVYPINRMIILRRYPDGVFLNENIDEMTIEPISTIVGWIKPDNNFGEISFNESWTKVNKRFDVLLNEIISKKTKGLVDFEKLVPIPDFAQGVLFEFYARAGLGNTSGIDEDYELFDAKTIEDAIKKNNDINISDNDKTNWGLYNIPIGDPNVLQEGPFRNPDGQNINSSFQFSLETTYEQKMLGDIDPGSAMLDILDNIYTMGTSNMVFYWGDESKPIKDAREASGSGNNLNEWWSFISSLMTGFWTAIVSLFNDVKTETTNIVKDIASGNTESVLEKGKEILKGAATSILASTIGVNRYELRGTIELMTGGKYASTPWHLSIGNPYSPWISTNHIIVESATIKTSNELGFNDMPQWITAKFDCRLSRSLGRQELLRMVNNTYRRTYSSPPPYNESTVSNSQKSNT